MNKSTLRGNIQFSNQQPFRADAVKLNAKEHRYNKLKHKSGMFFNRNLFCVAFLVNTYEHVTLRGQVNVW